MHASTEDEMKWEPSVPQTRGDCAVLWEGAASDSPQDVKLFHMVSVLPPSSEQL